MATPSLPLTPRLTRRACLRALLACAPLPAAGPVAAHHASDRHEVLRISGNGSGRGGIQMLVDAYEREMPHVRVEVMPPLGSSGAIRALLDRRIDIVVSSRPPTDAERTEAPLVSVEYARTPFVVAVHRNVGITALKSSELAALYAEGAARYPNGKRARPVLRLADANGTKLLRSFSPEVAQALTEAARRRGMLHADTESDAADLVERTPGAFAACTLALIESEKRPLVALAIDGKVPSVANLVDRSYPFYKSLYIIVRKSAGLSTRRFAAFVKSDVGRQMLSAHGHWVR